LTYDHCCKNIPVERVTFDCGRGEEEVLLLCEYHAHDDSPETEHWRKFVLKREAILVA
jgi:hypothetical protein